MAGSRDAERAGAAGSQGPVRRGPQPRLDCSRGAIPCPGLWDRKPRLEELAVVSW